LLTTSRNVVAGPQRCSTSTTGQVIRIGMASPGQHADGAGCVAAEDRNGSRAPVRDVSPRARRIGLSGALVGHGRGFRAIGSLIVEDARAAA
jgi:hypothetical protein